MNALNEINRVISNISYSSVQTKTSTSLSNLNLNGHASSSVSNTSFNRYDNEEEWLTSDRMAVS
jgi:hypothetical protein